MSSDIKAVPRFEYTPYGMVEVIDGWYINISDHEAAISELRSNHERVVGELEERAVNMKNWAKHDREMIEVLEKELETLRTALAASRAEVEELKKDAERYQWLRNPGQDVGLVMDKVVGETPMDEQGFGGYKHYEYRAGEELDTAIDAAMEKWKC